MTTTTSWRVALVGSTGGGTATLGHTDPPELLQIIHDRLLQLPGCTGISTALLVALEGGKGFDTVDERKDRALLYAVLPKDDNPTTGTSSRLPVEVIRSGLLQDVNQTCRELSQKLARSIRGESSSDDSNNVSALICISVSVDIFAETLQAASSSDIPVTGTGGTSLALAASRYQIRLVGNAGGSVANTSLTRAVSYVHALATAMNVPYQPWRKPQASHGPRWRSILNACLPAFWGVCLLRRSLLSINSFLESNGDGVIPVQYNPLARILSFQEDNNMEPLLPLLLLVLERHALPTACAVVTACSSTTTATNHGGVDTSSRIMASVVASTVASRSLLAGMLAGYLVARWQEKILIHCVLHNVPATMTNLLATGGVGAVIAAMLLPVSPLLQSLTALMRYAIECSVSMTTIHDVQFLPSSMAGNISLGAFLWGCLCCYGSKVGWYHALFLPLILVEMELGGASFLGAIDELTLVLVCAGICAANLVSACWLIKKPALLTDANRALCWRAVRINLLYGDFVEACYPEMEQNVLVNVSGYVASGLSSAILVARSSSPEEVPKSLAYLPWPVAVWLSGTDWWPMFVASVVAFGIPFIATLLNDILFKKAPIKQE
ncbi:phosphotransferase system component [Seminavis robusta]|uniref:Phosphotransferase system component n=1 Tax=Seminavis robusta TaxID=568900 RepID=A0A9N8DTW6_9STRA|nr:phosphotransferase system component [Seminavis robusta]|eukprot:Sro353_g124520.1 phosphotransferase system component (610) ;mRNA; f:40010-41839